MTERTPHPVLIRIDIDPGDDTLSLRESWTRRPIWAEFRSEEMVIALRLQANREEEPVLTELRIFPWHDEADRDAGSWNLDPSLTSGISPGFVKDIPLGRLRDQALAALADPNDDIWPGDADDKLGEWSEVTGRASVRAHRQSEPKKRAGRKPTTTDLELAHISYWYLRALIEGEPVHAYIVRKMGIERSLVGTRIHQARNRGFLVRGSGERGRKGGTVSEKALQVLSEAGMLDQLRQEET